MPANLSVIKREKLRDEVRRSLFRGLLDSSVVEDLAQRYGVSRRTVWKTRRWVLDHEAIVNPIDRRRERLATLHMLDSVTTAAASAGKYREAIAGLKLRCDLLSLGDVDDGQQGGRGGARSVDDLLETIGRAEGLRERLRAAVVHEDEEE